MTPHGGPKYRAMKGLRWYGYLVGCTGRLGEGLGRALLVRPVDLPEGDRVVRLLHVLPAACDGVVVVPLVGVSV